MADPNEDEASVFDEEATWRRDLERQGRLSAGVIIELQDRGPLYRYIAEKQGEAVKAMAALARIDPTEAAGIATLQGQIAAWLDACAWIHAEIELGDQAAQQINQEYGPHGEEQPTE